MLLQTLAALRAARFASVSNGSKSFKVTKDFTQMALSVQKHLKNGQHNDPEQPLLVQYFPKTHSLGKSLLLPYTLVSLVLDFTQMVLAVLNTLKWPL